ncbi:hypothetical protein U9M48_011508 [Paspalum notatum var. saurae]|uniref:Rx N-terminal domain-containing protein n=1 Tax=Paspalum notatum var. saurae TaxID=547442 RepID=A0AAQ3WH79_PASNO
MAQIVSTAVVQETVSKVLSNLVQKYDGREESNANRNMERLEMAHIRLEAVLETSDKWQITDTSLLRWRRKLVRAAQECDKTLKQRILEDEETEEEVSKSKFSKRIAHTAKSFVSSIFGANKDESNNSVVRRFEWFADGASEFLRLVELGGTPRRHVPFDPPIRHLLAGKKLHHRIIQADKCPLILLWIPFITAEHGIEGSLLFMQRDSNVLEDNFFLSIMLQLSESTDIVGVAVKCLQLFDPLFKSTVENIRKKLLQLPTQDLPWVPYVDSHQKERWDNLHSFGTRWFRPNPLCCKQGDLHGTCHSSKADMSEIQDVSLEPVIEANLHCQVSLSQYNRQTTLMSKGRISLQDPPLLKAGLLFMPHGSSEDLLPVNTSSATEVIHGDKQHCLHTNITLQHLEEIILPKAVDYFDQNAEASVYQILWKSKHGTAYIQVEAASIQNQRRLGSNGGCRKRKLLQRENQERENSRRVIPHFLELWGVHAPVWLQGSIADWIQKSKDKALAPYNLKISPYTKDTCPCDSVQGKGYCTSLNPRMAEIVSSAVVQETVSQVISNLVQKYEEKKESDANRNLGG